MAGTRHHILPRFLLRGFASHTVGNETYAWVYRASREPFNSNVTNIAVEGHFYTYEDRSDVDDAITAAEGDFAQAIEALRTFRSAEAIPPRLLGALIAHLEARTAHLRANFEDLVNAIFNRTMDFIEDHDAFKRFILLRFQREPETLVGPLREEIRARGVPDGATDLLVALLHPHLESFVESILPGLTAEFSSALRRIKSERPNLLRAAARNGQLRALEQAVAPSIKVAQYEQLSYSVIECAEGLPLGDSAVVFEIDADRRYTTFLSADDRLLSAYLPIATNLLLCGHVETFNPKTHALPEAVARCSREYFVAHANSEWFKRLQLQISQLSIVVDDVTIERLLAEAFEP